MIQIITAESEIYRRQVVQGFGSWWVSRMKILNKRVFSLKRAFKL
jgi:hypothetical protein